MTTETNVQPETNVEATAPAETTTDENLDFLETPKYDNNNTGTLAANRMRTKDSHPNARGKCQVKGIWYWISGWNKMSSSDNSRFVSLAFTEMSQEDVDKYINKVESSPTVAPAPAQEDDGVH